MEEKNCKAHLGLQERSKILRKWYDLMVLHKDDLAAIATAECGKPLSESKGEIDYSASYLEWFSEEAPRIYGDIIPPNAHGRRLLALKQPIGVCFLITPWNFPYAMAVRKFAAALAVGNTCVLKPAPETPLSALAMAELGYRAGVPDGVFNVLPTGKDQTREVAEEVMGCEVVRKVSFTGSTPVGKLLMKQSAHDVKRISLELGGNAPFIVFDDADVDAAVRGCVQSKFRNAGQTCVCVNRIYVQSNIHDIFIDKLRHAIKSLRLGNGFTEGVTIGPLITADAVKKVEGLVGDAVSKGASCQAFGLGEDASGNFYPVTLLTEMTDAMRIQQEEIFGPVAAVFKFETEEEVLTRANASPYGLAGYVYTSSTARQFRMAERLEVGMVGVNEGAISTEVAPFGGVKASGIGREGGRVGVEEYLQVKYMCVGGIDA
ncbi:Succinate-semialdehyde dehydrogenase, mitochondrial [Dinochytrium kinnereticum]|nr:Succinate-semialdehyde dehydrogenase, mitochondrial [Dinochytrium kinnereticum]